MSEPRAPRAEAVPEPVRAVLARLRAAGHEAVLVGGCVRDLLLGAAVADFDAATSAAPAAVLALFPRAVPIGLRHGTVMVPTGAGPLDVTSFRAGPRLEDDLAHRDFTVNAIAWDPASGRLVDPFDGAGDLLRRRLQAVGDARARFAEDPLRALRAARLVAALGLAPDPSLAEAMSEMRQPLHRVARERVRAELEALLLAPGAASGLALLRRAGLEAELAPGVAADAAAVVGALPRELDLRLAGWLRGTRAEAILLALRFGSRRAVAVARLLARHPVDRELPHSDADVRRLLRRAGEDGVSALLALREAELAASAEVAPEACERLAALRARVERVRAAGSLALRRADLAIDGRGVMELLGVEAGPWVGEALRHLGDCAVEDPSCNTRERLTAHLRAWQAARDARERRDSR
jgi:tRNA nucleotidyltransferase (CCA-adding enzyme)